MDERQQCEAILGPLLAGIKGQGAKPLSGLTDHQLAALRLHTKTLDGLQAWVGGAISTVWDVLKRRGLNSPAACHQLLFGSSAATAAVSDGAVAPEPDEVTIPTTALDAEVLKILQRQSDVPVSYAGLADAVDRSPSTVRAAVERLRDGGYAVRVGNADDTADTVQLVRQCVEEQRFSFPGWGEDVQRFGVVSDTHLGSAWCAIEALEAVYDRFAAEGITRVLHAGDLTDGPGLSSRHPRHRQDVHAQCLLPTGMRDWAVEHYPRRDGITTAFISGQHDDWELRKSGWDLATAIADRRDDLHHLGYQHADLFVGPEEKTRIRLYHPDGGMAYALSYRVQKWAEAMAGGDKPHLAIMGHLHQHLAIQMRNVHFVLPGCFQWQTFYLGGKPAWPQVGAVLLELHLDPGGDIRRIVSEWIPFYAPRTDGYHLPMARGGAHVN